MLVFRGYPKSYEEPQILKTEIKPEDEIIFQQFFKDQVLLWFCLTASATATL